MNELKTSVIHIHYLSSSISCCHLFSLYEITVYEKSTENVIVFAVELYKYTHICNIIISIIRLLEALNIFLGKLHIVGTYLKCLYYKFFNQHNFSNNILIHVKLTKKKKKAVATQLNVEPCFTLISQILILRIYPVVLFVGW